MDGFNGFIDSLHACMPHMSHLQKGGVGGRRMLLKAARNEVLAAHSLVVGVCLVFVV